MSAFTVIAIISGALMVLNAVAIVAIARDSDSPDERAEAWARLAMAALLFAAFAAGMMLA